MDEIDILRNRLKAYFRMLAVHDPILGNELVDVLDAYLDAKFKRAWVGLTPEEAREISLANRPYVVDMIAALEARLKEKNT